MLNFIASWHLEREAVRELSMLSDRALADLGIARADIRAVVGSAALASRESVSRPLREALGTMAPAWGAHARRSVAA